MLRTERFTLVYKDPVDFHLFKISSIAKIYFHQITFGRYSEFDIKRFYLINDVTRSNLMI